MTTVDFITHLFCRVDDAMRDVPHHSPAKWAPSELVTLALLYALKGHGSRAFWRWLTRDYQPLFPHLPDRTRLLRLFATHQAWADRFLADPTLLGVADTFGIELCHPLREGRTAEQLGAKGLSNHRWIVGVKLGYVVNSQGLIVDWDLDTANVHDNTFTELVAALAGEMGIYTASSCHRKEGDPANMVVCERGSRNQRMLVETVLSMLSGVCGAKRMRQRVWEHLTARISFLVAVFNLLVQWAGRETAGGRLRLSIAEFSL